MIKVELTKKKIAILLYVVYALGATMLLIFGNSVALWAYDVVYDKLNDKNITDVVCDVDAESELLAGTYHYVQYTAKGKFRGEAGLKFESLDPEYLTVNNKGRLYATTKFDGEKIDARVRITSSYDDDFEKVITFRFVKKYPERFTASYNVKGHGESVEYLTLGVPVYVFPIIEAGQMYNVSNYSIEYDEEYFAPTGDGSLTPIKATVYGETVSFTVKYANGSSASTDALTIRPSAPPEQIKEICLNGVSASEYSAVLRERIYLTVRGANGAMPTDYALTFEDESDVIKDSDGAIYFKSLGIKRFTLTLPGGESKEVQINVKNKIALPTVSDEAVATSHVIKLLDTDVKTFKLNFPSDVTYDTIGYEFDGEMITIASAQRSFTVTPKKHGTTTFKLVIDDGHERYEEVYTVQISKNKSLIAVIDKNVDVLVPKGMGHVNIFALLAVFAMNMFRFIEIKNRYLRLGTYTLTALPIATITEIAQLFIPNRTGRFSDVLLDMLGFYVGTALVLVITYALQRIRGRFENKKDEKLDTDSVV